jgi:hypothetical protein
MISLPPDRLHEYYDEEEFLRILGENCNKKCLHVFSDCGAEEIRKGNYKNPLDMSQMNARWLSITPQGERGVSFIFDAQGICSLSVPTRQNCDGAIIFEQYTDNEISILYNDFGKGNRKKFLQILNGATQNPFSFLFVHRQGPKQHYLVCFKEFIE